MLTVIFFSCYLYCVSACVVGGVNCGVGLVDLNLLDDGSLWVDIGPDVNVKVGRPNEVHALHIAVTDDLNGKDKTDQI